MRPYASTAFGSGTSSASIEDPVIVPASERIPNRSGTGSTLIGSSPPAPATISWPRKLSGLAARSKSSEQRRHGFAIGRCREDQSGTAQGLKRGNRLLNLGVNVMMCPEFLRETFLFRSARNGRDSKTHASRKLNSEVAKPTNALNSDKFAGPGL